MLNPQPSIPPMASGTDTIDHAENRNTASTTTTAEKISSPFLRLAAELRNRIYEHVFTGTIEISSWEMAISPTSGYGIVLACKQTYAESFALYYSTPTFRFLEDDNPKAGNATAADRCVQWSENIGAEAFSFVTNIETYFLATWPTPSRVGDVPYSMVEKHAFEIAYHVDRSLGILKRRLGVRWSSKVAVKTAIWSPLDLDPNGDFSVFYTSTPAETLYAHCVEAAEREVRMVRGTEDAVRS